MYLGYDQYVSIIVLQKLYMLFCERVLTKNWQQVANRMDFELHLG